METEQGERVIVLAKMFCTIPSTSTVNATHFTFCLIKDFAQNKLVTLIHCEP